MWSQKLWFGILFLSVNKMDIFIIPKLLLRFSCSSSYAVNGVNKSSSDSGMKFV